MIDEQRGRRATGMLDDGNRFWGRSGWRDCALLESEPFGVDDEAYQSVFWQKGWMRIDFGTLPSR